MSLNMNRGVLKMNFNKIIVLMGGPSSEAEISRLTGNAILKALKNKGYNDEGMEFVPETLVEDIKRSKCDIVFNAVHGKYGEDGKIAAALDMINMPYTSSGVLSSAVTMDKVATKHLFRSAGISTPKSRFLRKRDLNNNLTDEIIKEFSLPVVVKAASQGSSIGVEIVEKAEELKAALENSFKYDDVILIEEFIKGRELSIPVYGNDEKKTLPIIEITTNSGRYDYKSKYTKGESHHIIPAPLSEKVTAEVQKLCIDACTVADCKGMVRVDVMLSEDDIPYALEINSVPGMTETSLVPDAAQSIGIDFATLCEMILQMAVEK